MVSVHPKYVIDENAKPQAVLLPVSEWEQIVHELEELDDIRAYDKAMTTPQGCIPFDQAIREIQEESDA